MTDTHPATVVIFDCESDGKPCFGLHSTRNEAEFQYVQCTCVCALIVPIAQLPSLEGAVELTCWRDVAATPSTSPFEPLLKAFDAASIVVGYNAFDFDFPLLWKYYGRKQNRRYLNHRTKTLDIFARLRAVSGHWPKLDDLLRANDLEPKTSDGKEAIRMWHANDRDGLEAYCQADVQLTAKLALLPEIVFGHTAMPEHVYGLMPMVRAVVGLHAVAEEGGYVVV